MSADVRPIDETANLLTHGFGLLLSLPATAVLMTRVADKEFPVVVACGIYCLTLILLYAASALSHAFHDMRWRRFFRTVDQACIYLLIAGSFTPFGVVFLMHGSWWLLTAAVWLFAIAGVVLVIRLRNLSGTAMITYGILGWLPAVSLWELYQTAPLEMLLWFVAGGACYSIGTFFLRFDRIAQYMHATWHVFVIAGSACHYIAALQFVAS